RWTPPSQQTKLLARGFGTIQHSNKSYVVADKSCQTRQLGPPLAWPVQLTTRVFIHIFVAEVITMDAVARCRMNAPYKGAVKQITLEILAPAPEYIAIRLQLNKLTSRFTNSTGKVRQPINISIVM